MSLPSHSPILGSVLITGGTGFLGTALVSHLHKNLLCAELTVLDLNPPDEPLKGVRYITGTITSSQTISNVMKSSKPDVIFHTASPNPTNYHGPGSYYFDVNVTGTKLLVEEAKRQLVKAFINLGSMDAYEGFVHVNLTEDAPFWTEKNCPPNHEYGLSKAIADVYVRDAATESFKTANMRPSHLYGIGDTQAIPAALEACEPGKPLVQLGDGQNLFDICSTDNCVDALVLVAHALLTPSFSSHVNGQAFHIADGPAIKFWDFFAEIWSEGRGRDIRSELWVMPAWLVWFLVGIIEWFFWISTAGRRKPRGKDAMERAIMVFCLGEHSYDGRKAEKVLGYRPKGEWRSVLREATQWEIKRREMQAGKAQKKEL